jgi:polyvinyl alcohol dehydrogenase (cytochrome)
MLSMPFRCCASAGAPTARGLARLLVVLVLAALLPHVATAQDPGEAVYRTRCAACHDNADGRTPPRAVLQAMTPSRILRTLDFGAMMTIAYTLRRDEREAVSRFLGKPGPEPQPRPQAYCTDRSVQLGDASSGSWNGWSPSPDNARFAAGPLARLTVDQVRRLKLKWAFGFEDDISAFAQPTVIGNQIFVGSAGGLVHALRADSGCLQWTFQANGPIRSAIVAAPFEGGYRLVFGDLTGWFYALDPATGRQLWRMRPEEHEAVRLSAPPLIHDGLAIVPVASWEESRSLNQDYPCCTFRGSVVAIRLRDGTVTWKQYMVPTPAARTGKTPAGAETLGPSGVAIWGAPALDVKRRRLYVTTGNNYSLPATTLSDAIVALDLDTGAIVWSHQALPGDVYNSACSLAPKGVSCPEGSGPDYDFGAPPILVSTAGGRDLVLAGQKSGIVWAVDPDANGRVVWQSRVARGGINGGVQWGMASDGQRVYAATSDVVVARTATTRTLDPSAGGGLTALRIGDGSVEWHAEPPPCGARPSCSPAQLAAVTAMPGVVFAGSLDGHLRAHSAADGTVLWEFDTAREYQTVNGVAARGGAIDGPGAVVVNGMVLVNSGYMRFGGLPGNVLLAFDAD